MRSEQCVILGIIAQAGHGKDTCAQILIDEYGFARRALADCLKEDIHKAFEAFPECSLEAQNSRDRAPWVRRLQQVYGTEWCRDRLGESYWLTRWGMEAKPLIKGGCRGIAIPDIRFPNELTYLRREYGAKMVYVERPGYQEPGVDPTHASERYVRSLRERADIIIANVGTVGDLRQKIIREVGVLLEQ